MFWKLNFLDRKQFILKHVKNIPIKRRRSESKTVRSHNYNYFLYSEKCSCDRQVCKVFFLTTLGFEGNNDFVVKSALTNGEPITMQPNPDGRGKATDAGKIVRHDLIKKHIESFNPNVSHYRREHAPNRRYLPDTLTISEMHKDLVETNPS